MKIKQVSIPITISILVSSLPAYANSMGLNNADMAFCSQVRDSRVKEVVANSQSSSSGRVNTNFDGTFAGGLVRVHGDSQGSGWDKNSSSSSRDYAMSQYQSKNCDTLLRTAGQVTIAQINANSRQAIARMQQESAMYGEDTKRIVENIKLEAIKDTNATNLGIATNTNATNQAIAENTNATNQAIVENTNATNQAIAQDTNATALNIVKTQTGAATNSTLINTAGGIVSTLISSSARKSELGTTAEIERQRIAVDLEKARIAAETERARFAAETERAKIAAANADPVAQLLAQWGWARIPCSPGVVFITGMSTNAVCVNPTATIPAGQYSYNPASNQLLPVQSTSTQPMLTPGTNGLD